MKNAYHGYIIYASQRDKDIFKELHILGCKTQFMGLIKILKVEIPENKMEQVAGKIRSNMSARFGLIPMEWCAHFYRGDELIVVFRKKIFRVTPDPSSWDALLAYGRSLHIPQKKLDFSPCRFEEETD